MELDWNLCVICQRKTSEALKCSLEHAVKKGNKKDAYTNFLNHVKQFQDIDSLQVIVKFGCDETAEKWEFQRASCVVCVVRHMRNLAAANLKEQN